MKKAAEIIIECLKKKKMSQSKLAQEMGEDVRLINQQLTRYKDLKFGRFRQVLGFIGYRVEVVDNNGIKRIPCQAAMDIIETGKPKGKFWFVAENDGLYNGLDNSRGEVFVETFNSEEECLTWLMDQSAEGNNNLNGG